MGDRVLFIGYARADAKWLEMLRKHLALGLRRAGVKIWDDSRIPEGELWRQEIAEAIEAACAAVLLVSPDFLGSEFIIDTELPALEEAAHTRGIPLMWIPIRSSAYEQSALAERQALHSPKKPLAELKPAARERAFVEISKKIVETFSAGTEPAGLPKGRAVLDHYAPDQSRASQPPVAGPRSIATPMASEGMFPALQAARFSEHVMTELGAAMTDCKRDPIPEDEPDPEENSGISAGYTQLGQLIYNDISFESYTAPFNLDGLYGGGPDRQSYLYQRGGTLMLPGAPIGKDFTAPDVPRNSAGRALIGDPRNDENIILSQLHGAMLCFHNATARTQQGSSFAEIRQIVRFHYQWVVLYDFLPRIVGIETLHDILPHMRKRTSVFEDPPRLEFFQPDGRGTLPPEFSLAAFRFGHSMVRPYYRLNVNADRVSTFPDASNTSLIGFRPIPQALGVDWDLFFAASNPAPKLGPRRVQPSYKIDTALPNAFGSLPVGTVAQPPSLAARNLLRGLRAGLPSGQAVAERMGIAPIRDDALVVGRATEADMPRNKPVVHYSPEFRNNAPLWFYILAEAQQGFRKDDTPIRLGPVGGRIVAEVIVGLMWSNPASFLRVKPRFQPDFGTTGGFTMSELIKRASFK